MNESVTRAIDVLVEVASSDGGFGARELAQRIGLPRSTVQRILQTLEASAMVEQDPVSRRYRLGAQTLHLGMVALSRVDVRTKAMPHMAQLRDVSGETVGLSILSGTERMYIEQLTSRHELRSMAAIGQLYPLYSGAPGRVLLASLDDKRIDEILTPDSLVPLTGHTPPTKERLLELIAETREKGYAIAFEETILGVNTIAAPVRDYRGAVDAALSVSGPASRFGGQAMNDLRKALLDSAEGISLDLGFVPARPTPGER